MTQKNTKEFVPGKSNDTHYAINAFCSIEGGNRVKDFNSVVSKKIISELKGNFRSFLENIGSKNSEKILKIIESAQGKISAMDFLRMPNFSDNDILLIVINLLGKDCFDNINDRMVFSEKKMVEKFNDIMNKSKDFYEVELFRTIPRNFIPGKGTEFNFKSLDDIVQFISDTGKNNKGSIRQIRCNLLKTAFLINQVEKEPKLARSDMVFREILDDHILTKFVLMDKSGKYFDRSQTKLGKIKDVDDLSFFTQHKPEDGIPFEGISEFNFTTIGRDKTGASAVLKLGYRSKYTETDLINDYFGLQSEVKTPEDAVLLLQYLYYKVFDKNIRDFGNKGLVTRDFLDKIKSKLTDEFYNVLIKEFDLNKNSHSQGHNPKRNNVDLVGNISHNGMEYPIERQIWLVDNKNETGFQHHGIYDGFKKIAFMIRLQGYVSKSYIRRVASMYIKKHSELLRIGGGDFDKTLEKIVDYYINQQGEIVELSIPGVNVPFKYYTTKDRRNILEGTEFYPEATSILSDGKWKNRKSKI